MCLLMAGYAKDTPEITSVFIPCKNGIIDKPRLNCAFSDPAACFTLIGGYPEVYEDMRVQGVVQPPKDLSSGVQLITRACSHYCKVLLLISGQDGDHRSAV